MRNGIIGLHLRNTQRHTTTMHRQAKLSFEPGGDQVSQLG